MTYRLLHIFFLFLWGSITIQAQEVVQRPVNVMSADSIPALSTDTTGEFFSDTIPPLVTDSIVAVIDTVQPKSTTLDAPVYYEATDSIVMTGGNWAYLYGDADVKYQQIQLQAEIIEISMDSSILFAKFGLDSIGEEFGYPLFIDGDQQYESKTMRYNFKTKKGYITDVVTQQGEGYVTSAQTKKMEDDILNMLGGKYTTCDHHEHPHFYIQMTRAKVRPKKNIVTGPVYLVIEDVPLPLGLPFAFFPFSDTYSSGVIFPSFGDESARGFFIRDGGYYFAINDYVDLALTADIYTKGSWGVSARSSYRKRYKFSGSFSANYAVNKLGDKGLPDYSLSKDFKINWTHSQDAKANPFRTFSASVNYATSSYNTYQYQESMNYNNTNNSKSSSINVTQRFPSSPFSLSASMMISQSARDTMVSVTLPDLTITMSRIYPFKRKQRIGKERFYEKISLSYTGAFKNYISTKEYDLFNSNLIKDWQNGMKHNIQTSATFSLLKYVNFTTSFNYRENWGTKKVERAYDPGTNQLVARDTTYGFYRMYDYNPSVSFETTLYGMYTPMKFMQWTRINAIRHRVVPSVSFSMTPDFTSARYGYYRTYYYINANGELVENTYSPYSDNLFGPPSGTKSGSINFSLDNNLEMKVRTGNDSLKKVSLIDKLGLSMNYNMVADSFNWSNLTANLRLKLTKSYTLNLNMVFDTYTYEYNEATNTLRRVNTPRWKAGKGIGRLQTTGTSFSYTFNNDTFKKLFGGKSDSPSSSPPDGSPDHDPLGDGMHNDELEGGESMAEEGTGRRRLRGGGQEASGDFDKDGYTINTFPWSFSVNYSMSLQYDNSRIDRNKNEYKYRVNHNLSFNGSLQPTKNWRVSFNATYDFDNKKISYMTCNISRVMHCWNMSASISPVGIRKYYSFTIAVSSSMLKDLKWDKSASPRDGQTWY